MVFGLEATGIYSLPLCSALIRDGYKVRLYNPIQTNGFRKMNVRKTKTDPIDATIIADMLCYSEPPQVIEIKDLNPYQLRELVRIRHHLIEKQTVCKIQMIRNIDMIWPNYVSLMIISIEIKTLITQLELYDGQIQSVEDKIDQMMKLIQRR